MHYLSPWCCWGLDDPVYQDWSPIVLNLFAKKKTFSCLFLDFRLIFVFIFLFGFIFFCSSWYLTEIKIYNNQFDQGTSPPSPYLACFYLVLMCILIFCFLFIEDIYLRVSFLTLRTMFGLGLGGMHIDFYLFVLFCLIVLKKLLKKKKKNLPSLRFMFWVCYTTLA